MNKAFTLIEVIVAIVILGILASVGYPLYRNVIEDSNARVCAANQATAVAALDLFRTEYHAVPASLGMLPDKYVERAYAMLLRKNSNWRLKLAYFIVELSRGDLAYAAGSLGVDTKILHCPMSKDSVSYGINDAIAGLEGQDLENAWYSIKYVIMDADQVTFNEDPSNNHIKSRHSKMSSIVSQIHYAQGVTRIGGQVAARIETGSYVNCHDYCPAGPATSLCLTDCLSGCKDNTICRGCCMMPTGGCYASMYYCTDCTVKYAACKTLPCYPNGIVNSATSCLACCEQSSIEDSVACKTCCGCVEPTD